MNYIKLTKTSFTGRIFRCMGISSLPDSQYKVFFRYCLVVLLLPIFWGIYMWGYPKTTSIRYYALIYQGYNREGDVAVTVFSIIATVLSGCFFLAYSIQRSNHDTHNVMTLWGCFVPIGLVFIGISIAMISKYVVKSKYVIWEDFDSTPKIEVK